MTGEPLTPAQRSLRARVAANTRWSKCADRTAATAAATAASPQSRGYWERRVDPDGTLPAAERATRAGNAHRAHMQSLALRSSRARGARRGSDPQEQPAQT